MTEDNRAKSAPGTGLGSTVSLGSVVWILNPNRRVYRKDERGQSYGEMWEEDKIVGENSRSWIIGEWRKLKIPKKGGPWSGIAFSREDVDQRSWVAENRHRVVEMVRAANFDQLKRIEAIMSALPNIADLPTLAERTANPSTT